MKTTDTDYSEKSLTALVAVHGADRVLTIAQLFANGHRVMDVARLFGVTRATAWHWRRALCVEHHVFLVHPDVQFIANEREAA